MGNGNRPTPEFRREAVRLALTSGRTRREIAEDLGIGLSTLTRWLSQERDVREPSEAPSGIPARRQRCRTSTASDTAPSRPVSQCPSRQFAPSVQTSVSAGKNG